MAKTTGGVRRLTTGSREYVSRQSEVDIMRKSGRYSSIEFHTKGGGYVAIEKSSFRHKPEELEAARILADNGYKVILKNEGGNIKTPDGYLFSASFEQRTPTKDGGNTIRNALFHARDKRAEIAVMYSKNNAFTKESVSEGIKMYEEANKYRFKQIIVVADNGHIHRHRHNI